MSNSSVMKNTEMLQKYLVKYNAWFNDDNKVANFREALAYYSQLMEIKSEIG